jgi:hypothetical protein
MPYVSSAAVGRASSKNDPCKHPNNRKKRKYVVYIAQDLDNPGKIYVGRTRGPAGASTKDILAKRKSTHHRNLSDPLVAVCETTSYAAIRGAEQAHQQHYAKLGTGTDQINPISPRNPRKKKYEDCAKQTNTSCAICSGS